MKKINWKILIVFLAVLVAIGATTIVWWVSDELTATESALRAVQSDSQVLVSAENGWLVFTPATDSHPKTGLVFYPGGLVDYRAYAPVLKLIAQQGYFVALVPMFFNVPFFDVNAASRVQAQYPEVRNWAIGGHSLGGMAASSYAANHFEIKGVVFWASYPANGALRSLNIKVISIYGTNDGLATVDKIDESRALLPTSAQFIAIEGGNHSQFGSYGLQPHDSDAAISAEEQWSQIAQATVEFLKALR